LPFGSAAGKQARRSAPEDVQGRPRNLWSAFYHAFRIHGYRSIHVFDGRGAGYPRPTVERAFLCKVD